jgi:hypothetical protein
MRSVRRRFLLTFITAWGAYCLAVSAISGWFGWEPPKAGLGLYLAAVLPALPVGVAIFAWGRYFSELTDEFLRMVQVKAMSIGTGLTMFTCTAWGFLAQYAHVWAPPLYLVFPMWWAFYGLALPVVNRRYR